MLSGLLSVNEDFGFLIDTFEMELGNIGIGGLECLAILALTAFKPTTAGACGSLAGVWTFVDVPVVRQVYIGGLAVTSELPVIVKQQFVLCCCCHGTTQHHCK